MSSTNTDRMNRFYELFTGFDHVLILINADPDAIASAMALKRILWRRVTNVTISNINSITRPDNMAMIRLLDVTLIHITKVNTHHYNKFVIVDSQPDHNEAFGEFSYTAIIDHHEDSGIDAPYRDIRPEYGATASIVTEYLRAARIKPSPKLATGLFYAIKTDTANFERKAVNEDMRAFQYLFKHTNIHLARKIEQVDLRLDFMDDFKKAITEHVISDNKIFVNLGTVKNPDICVLIADFFMRFNLVAWSVVSGIHGDKLVVVVRNDGNGKNAGNLMAARFGRFGSAGGHQSMARAESHLSKVAEKTDVNDPEKLLAWIIAQFENKKNERNSCQK